MSLVNRMSLSYPLALSIFLVLISVFISQVGAVALAANWDTIGRDTFSTYTRYGVALATIVLLWRMGIVKQSGISNPYNQWAKRWYIAILPIIFVGCLNFINIHWSQMSFTLTGVTAWLFDNLSTGVFEEIMMRSLAFYLLYRAWQHSNHGLYKAAFAQALIFGLLHFINLINGFQIDVIAQVIYATFLGVSFAGIVAYSKTIWPAAIAHGFVNAIGNLNSTFVPDYVETSTAASTYAIYILVIFVVATLPGLYMLKLANQRQEVR
ncbi:MAG: CPBP family intramembrane glutamic endopeptidase [Aestuariibacter sp.]